MKKNRREFLKTAGIGVLGVGAAAVMGGRKVFAAAEGVPDKPVKIGIMGFQAGVAAVPGIAGIQAAEIWAEQVNQAVAAAKDAQKSWRKTPAPVRGEFVFKAMRLMEERAEDIAAVLSREEGKTLTEARGELKKSIKLLEFIGGEGRRFGGDVMPSEMTNTLCYTVRQPLGVVGIITPWNFPVAIPTWKIAPALVAGNAVVFKPAGPTPLTGRMVTECFVDAGLPAGVVNFVPGPGGSVGEALSSHEDVAAISFTGSTEIGMKLASSAATNHKKCQCEMGGKNPVVIFGDANLEVAAASTVEGAFGSAGQRCTATSRAIVERSVYDRFLQLVIEGARDYRVGNPKDEGTRMGPSVDQYQWDQVHKFIAIGKEEGARLAYGGGKLTEGDYAHGFYTEPTIFADVDPKMRIAQEEVFGPVLAVIPFDTFDEAMEIANGVKFGLSSSVYTRDIVTAQRFLDEIETGITHVNSPTLGGEAQLPFGGIKATGVGQREMGTTAVEFYSELKTIYIDYTGKRRETNIY